jgi:hypothetical protein
MIQIFPKLSNSPAGADHIDGARFYEKGKFISLYADGGQRGKVRIESVKDYQCNSAGAGRSDVS